MKYSADKASGPGASRCILLPGLYDDDSRRNYVQYTVHACKKDPMKLYHYFIISKIDVKHLILTPPRTRGFSISMPVKEHDLVDLSVAEMYGVSTSIFVPG